MKKLFAIFACGCSLSAFAADVVFNLTQLGQSPVTNRAVLVKAEWLNPTNSIGLPDAAIYRTDTNGSLTISNVPESILNIEVMAPPSRLAFSIYVPDTNGAVNVADLRGMGTGGRLDPSRYALSVRASDARYARAGSAAVANVLTNGGVYYPDPANTNVWFGPDGVGGFIMHWPDYGGFQQYIGFNASDIAAPTAFATFSGVEAGGFTLDPDNIGNFQGRGTADDFINCNGSGIFYTNAAGAKFFLAVNATTNGFIFVPAP